MKKIKLFSLLVILASFVFTSCNSSLTITKRHSKRGYYIATNKIKKSHFTKIEESEISEGKTFENSISDPLATTLNNKVNSKFENESNLQNEYQNSSSGTITLKENSSSNALSDVNYKPNAEKKSNKSLFENTKNKVKTINTIQKSASKAKKALATAPNQDALSLLWIVIVILLILWLIGLILGNLGGLIHLLLVIALILLILWLLKII